MFIEIINVKQKESVRFNDHFITLNSIQPDKNPIQCEVHIDNKKYFFVLPTATFLMSFDKKYINTITLPDDTIITYLGWSKETPWGTCDSYCYECKAAFKIISNKIDIPPTERFFEKIIETVNEKTEIKIDSSVKKIENTFLVIISIIILLIIISYKKWRK